jgi:hypothetical protein
MDGGHHRLGACLNAVTHLGQDGGHGRLTKLTDIRPRNKSTARPQQEDTFDTRNSLSFVDRRHQATAHIDTDGIDRGMVNRDDQQVTVFGCVHNGSFRTGGQTKAPHCFVLDAIVWQIIFLDNLKLY